MPKVETLESTSATKACEHAFVTSQGTAHGRFTRAVQQRNLWAAEASLRELGSASLEDALGYLDLVAEQKPEKVERAVRYKLDMDKKEFAEKIHSADYALFRCATPGPELATLERADSPDNGCGNEFAAEMPKLYGKMPKCRRCGKRNTVLVEVLVPVAS